jgi:DNA polymerase (family 10)
VEKVEFAGSLRRGRETIGDLDFLATTADPEALRQAFTTLPAVTQVLARGETKCSVRLAAGAVALQADLRIVRSDGWGAALLYFTGSKEHNVRLREIAIKAGRRLNEYGLFEGKEERPQDAGQPPLAAATEEEIYQALALPWIAPELREDRGELDGPFDGEPSPLIRREDVRAELHCHTQASDGRLTIEGMAEAARSRGFHTIAITDHSQSSVIANGLSPDRLLRHIEAIREADAKVDGIRILAGAEVDILTDGRLDYEDDLLAQLDVVVASPHVGLRQEPEAATQRLLAAIRHPLVHIIGHPTGRIINKREGLSPHLEELFEAAVEHDTALELNANWQRLDLRDTHLRSALERGVKISIDTDAHDEPHFDFLVYGILTARRAAMAPEACINTWPEAKLHAWLRSKR